MNQVSENTKKFQENCKINTRTESFLGSCLTYRLRWLFLMDILENIS